jgi:repressor LexA
MNHLQTLEAAGFIEMSGKSRGIRLRKDLGVPIVGRIAAGQPIESPELPETHGAEDIESYGFEEIPVDPNLFAPGAAPGDIVALRIHGDSMVEAGILDGDLAIIRRQQSVEDGDIAAVLIDGEGTLKRWQAQGARGRNPGLKSGVDERTLRLDPANQAFDPIVIRAGDHRDVRVFGKYVGLIRRS